MVAGSSDEGEEPFIIHFYGIKIRVNKDDI